MPQGKWFSLSAVLRLLHVSAAETQEEIVVPAFLRRPGMGGTTIARPEPLTILRAIFNGGETRIRLEDEGRGIKGAWTIDPESCEINDEGTQIVLQMGSRRLPVSIEGMSECGPQSYAFLLEITEDGSGLSGYRCFRSSLRKDLAPRRIILVSPKSEGLPGVPRDE